MHGWMLGIIWVSSWDSQGFLSPDTPFCLRTTPLFVSGHPIWNNTSLTWSKGSCCLCCFRTPWFVFLQIYIHHHLASLDYYLEIGDFTGGMCIILSSIPHYFMPSALLFSWFFALAAVIDSAISSFLFGPHKRVSCWVPRRHSLICICCRPDPIDCRLVSLTSWRIEFG